ncbi:MAG: FecR family protein [Lentisphaeraceae bacterium]|nr:FecR family protein [Lentisphaeraceae bacterium]
MNDETTLKNLISAMLDDNLTEEQAKELDSILQNSSEARDTYRRLVDMHFTLNEISENKQTLEFPDLPTPENFPEEFRSTRKQLITFQAIAALLAIAFFISSMNTKEVIREVEVVKEAIPKTVLASIESISADVNWESSVKKVGDKLYSEDLILTQGQVTIKYNHGAEIKLEGPVHYQLKSLELAQLNYGQMAAKVPEAAQGFTVEAPKAAIVDLGTEFALNVTKDDKSQVHVYE